MKVVRWLFTVIGGLMVLPVVTGFFVDYAKQTDAYKKPGDTLGAVWDFAVSLAHNAYFSHTTALAVGLVVGLWVDWLLRRFDASRASNLRSLGYDMSALAGSIDNAQTGFRGEWPDNIAHLLADLMSVSAKAQKLGFATPSNEILNQPHPGFLIGYFQIVGKFLTEDQFDEARKAAEELSTKVAVPAAR